MEWNQKNIYRGNPGSHIYMSVRARRLERGHLGRRCLRGGVSKRYEAREGEAREGEWLEQEQSGEAEKAGRGGLTQGKDVMKKSDGHLPLC